MMRRGEFLRFGAAALASAALPPGAAFCAGEAGGVARLRVGVLSDIHLIDAAAALKLERALTAFRDRRVDGVLVCGDLADSGVVPQLEELARIWEKVFPGSKGLDGEPVARLFHYGDHDNRGYVHQGDYRAKEAYGWTDEDLRANVIFNSPGECWERIFGEPWSPIVHKRVKGFDFVLAHFNPKGRNTTLGLGAFLRNLALDPAKPFFYSQHRVLRNTVCGSGVWGQDDGTVGRLLSKYPNCCAFCGHAHQTAVREDSIWQGGFTAVQVPSLRYVVQEPGHVNKPNGYAAEQGMLLAVYDDRMVLERIDFTNREPLAEAWNIPLVGGERPFARESRRRAAAVPEFPAGAALSAKIEEVHGSDGRASRSLALEFPIVNGSGGGVRAYDYEVAVDAICFGGDVQRSVKRCLSPRCHFAPSTDAGTMKIVLGLGEFKTWMSLKSRRLGAIHVSVRPREIFGACGAAIEADVV